MCILDTKQTTRHRFRKGNNATCLRNSFHGRVSYDLGDVIGIALRPVPPPRPDRDRITVGLFRQQIDLQFDVRHSTVRVHAIPTQHGHHH